MRYLYLVFFLFVAACSSTGLQKNTLYKEHPLAIVQGSASKEASYFTVLSKVSKEPLTYFYSSEDEEPKQIYSFFKKQSPDGKRVVEHFQVKGLNLLKTYKFVVKEGGSIVDERAFKALDTSKKNVRIGVASCMDDNIPSDDIWQSYLNKFLDVNFFIGDNVYADRVKGEKKVADYKQLWDRNIQTWDRLYFYHSSQLSPTYFVWDDHDYGQNDGDKNYKHKEKSLEVFNTFYPRGALAEIYSKTMGAGSELKAFGQDFVFIDNRFFRDKGESGSHWGAEQKKLILNKVKKSKAKMVWLIQGDQFFGGYHGFESFEGQHPQDFKKTLNDLKRTKKKILFVSGDRHLTEVMGIAPEVLGYKTYEITSSGIHAVVFPGAFEREPNPRQEIGKSGVYNFSVIDIGSDDNGKSTYKVTSYGPKDWTHYTKELDF